jgi:hypothetical protein
MNIFLLRLWHWIWGLPQNLLGLILMIYHRNDRRSTYRECVVIHWGGTGSMSLGMFLFLGNKNDPRVIVHEYGHTVQALFLGPLYLLVIGIPSFVWCNLPPFRKLRKEKGVSYYRFYPESIANYLGAKVTKETCDLQ